MNKQDIIAIICIIGIVALALFGNIAYQNSLFSAYNLGKLDQVNEILRVTAPGSCKPYQISYQNNDQELNLTLIAYECIQNGKKE